MPTLPLPAILELVTALPPDDQQALYAYLGELLPHPAQPVVQVAGTLGSAIAPEAGDVIAAEVDALRGEHHAHFDAEWDTLP